VFKNLSMKRRGGNPECQLKIKKAKGKMVEMACGDARPTSKAQAPLLRHDFLAVMLPFYLESVKLIVTGYRNGWIMVIVLRYWNAGSFN
jgi:hypothetical protein